MLKNARRLFNFCVVEMLGPYIILGIHSFTVVDFG